jgi:alkylhydroperoxidase/carboxymuconolactone decarboxylase family protein YurZ
VARKRTNKSNRNRLPAVFSTFIEKYPGLAEAHEAAARFVDQVGPLDARTRALVKIGICLGAGLESALRSHVRRGRKAGLKPIEIEQAILLGMTTVGFPRTVAGWTWAHQALDDQP